MKIWAPVRRAPKSIEALDGLLPKAMGAVLAGVFAAACGIAAVLSIPYAILAYLLGQAIIVLVVHDYLLRGVDEAQVMLYTAILSPTEKKLFGGSRLFFLCPLAAANLAYFLKYTRVFGVAWLCIAVWHSFSASYNYFMLAGSLIAYFVIIQWTIVRLCPTAHDEAASAEGDRMAKARLPILRHMLVKRADVFGGATFSRIAPGEWDR